MDTEMFVLNIKWILAMYHRNVDVNKFSVKDVQLIHNLPHHLRINENLEKHFVTNRKMKYEIMPKYGNWYMALN